MGDRTAFDHLAIAVQRWSDGYPALVELLGGRWSNGGVTETFSPGQLEFDGQMKIELLAPGSAPDGFVSRFLEGHGAGAHHLTFKVRDMDEFVAGAEALGYELMGAHLDLPGRRETFIHPKASGFGTLLQALEYDEHHGGTPTPDGMPDPADPAHRISWVALVVPELQRAVDLFGGVLHGEMISRGDVDGGRWILLAWSAGRRLLLLDAAAAAAIGRCGGGPGVDHVLFVPPGIDIPEPGDVAGLREVGDSDALGLPVLTTTAVEAIPT